MRMILSNEDWNKALKDDPKVIAQFGAPWCAPCKYLEPILEQLEAEYNVRVIKVDITFMGDLANTQYVNSLPTLLYFEGGRRINQLSGTRTIGSIIDTFRLTKRAFTIESIVPADAGSV